VVFPELLGSVLAGDSLEDLGSAGVLVYEVCFGILVSESKDVGGWNFGEPWLKEKKRIEVRRARARQVEWWGDDGTVWGKRPGKREDKHTGNIVNTIINNDVQPTTSILMRCYIGDGEGLWHLEYSSESSSGSPFSSYVYASARNW
jgi:hypothetical protein